LRRGVALRDRGARSQLARGNTTNQVGCRVGRSQRQHVTVLGEQHQIERRASQTPSHSGILRNHEMTLKSFGTSVSESSSSVMVLNLAELGYLHTMAQVLSSCSQSPLVATLPFRSILTPDHELGKT
jgi:hypothetical protein